MDESYALVPWTYPSEPDTASHTDEDPTTRPTTVIHHHHHYHHHYNHTSPPPPQHREHSQQPSTTHTRDHRTPERETVSERPHWRDNRYVSSSPPTDIERGSHSPSPRRRERQSPARPRVPTRRYRTASRGTPTSPLPRRYQHWLRTPSPAAPNLRAARQQQHPVGHDNPQSLDNPHRRQNRRRPSNSPEGVSPRRISSLSLQSPENTLRQGARRTNATPAHPNVNQVSFTRLQFGFQHGAAAHFARARRGRLT